MKINGGKLSVEMCGGKVFCIVLLVTGAWAIDNVTVHRINLSFDELHTLSVSNNVEYMVNMIPSEEQSRYPSRITVRSGGGDTVHPVLITARQRTGAETWQLPYKNGNQLIYEMTRTLCPDPNENTESECSHPDTYAVPNSLTLHLSSTCESSVAVSLLAAPAREWRLPYGAAASVTATPAAPHVSYYMFQEGQSSVRLVVESSDDICATLSVQNVTCPIFQSESIVGLSASGLRMTVQNSAGTQLSRSRYPLGFYLVTIVRTNDVECTGEAEEGSDWLWGALWGDLDVQRDEQARNKSLTITLRASLSKGEYALATGLTLAFFLMFYVLFFALVFAQRWPAFAKHVSSLAPKMEAERTEVPQTEIDASNVEQATPARRRRDSTATFDSSDNSDSDEEATAAQPAAAAPAPATAPVPVTPAGEAGAARGGAAPPPAPGVDADGNGVQTPTPTTPDALPPLATPFGLPPRLRLDALSRHRARVLRVRSDRYLHTLYTVAVFYALPVVQFVTAFQIILNVSGSLDICYYNFLCSHPTGGLSDFNHVFSNLGYLLLGALFMLQVRRRRQRRKREPRNEEYGIPPHYGLLSSLGASMMVVGVLSASYHVCPNRLNFQFDTAFMYVLAVVSMVKIYQSRHPDVNARAHATFGVLAVLIALVVWGVLGGGPFFWAIFTVLHIATFLLLSLRIYYVGQFRLERDTLQRAARELAQMPKHGVRPLYSPRLVMLLIANGVNWAIALYGLWTQAADIAGHLLQLLLLNLLLHMVFYLTMKLLHGERPRWYAWGYLLGAFLSWGPALYFFLSGSSNWATTPSQSRHMNHECKVLQFYDSHDMWHMLSAVALYLSFSAMLTWDDGLAAVKRSEIAVF